MCLSNHLTAEKFSSYMQGGSLLPPGLPVSDTKEVLWGQLAPQELVSAVQQPTCNCAEGNF